jgi:hypothetical protein
MAAAVVGPLGVATVPPLPVGLVPPVLALVVPPALVVVLPPAPVAPAPVVPALFAALGEDELQPKAKPSVAVTANQRPKYLMPAC